MIQHLHDTALSLLQSLIATPSFSKEEDKTADLLEAFLRKHGAAPHRAGNNVWAIAPGYDPARPTILLNSHHDTVRPNSAYTRDPFAPVIEDGKLYGLGSNDAGGPLVSLIAAFLWFSQQPLKANLVLAATAEEEISGRGGIESIWSVLPRIDMAVVGEPTCCEMAVAEKGLMVVDCVANGVAGHAARNEGVNAIYVAMQDIEWFRTYRFPNVSDTLGEIKMTVTIIQAGSQHNVVPVACSFTVDIRLTDVYTPEEVLDVIRAHVTSEVTPRSTRLRASGIAANHPLVASAKALGIPLYGSPTTSDQALIPVPSVKIGPGDSARSHSANEYIGVSELAQGIQTYINLLTPILV